MASLYIVGQGGKHVLCRVGPYGQDTRMTIAALLHLIWERNHK
jgi:hypothetical protein